MSAFRQSGAAADDPARVPPPSPPTANDLTSVITAGLFIIGDVRSTGNIEVEGVIKGDIDCAKLTINKNGAIEGNIRAQEVVIHGRASGSIMGRSVMIHITAEVEADIGHQGIGIEMGTRYEGRLHWLDDSAFEAAQNQSAAQTPTPAPGPITIQG